MIVLLIAPPPAVAPAVAVPGQCADCGHLVAESAPGVLSHLDDVCRECLGTGAPCPYPYEHGTGACAAAEALACAWCHRVLEVGPDGLDRCPDHRAPCCGCCQP